MNILEYLLKASVGLALFLGGYLLIYRHDTFFKWNRIYFLIGSLAVLLLPFINLKSFFEKPTLTNSPVLNFVPRIAYLPVFRQSQTPLVEKGFWDNFSMIEILIIVFLLGALVMFGRFLLQCLSLYSLKRKAVEVPFQTNKWLKIIKERLYFLTQPINPFSFFNWIFVSPSLHTEQELNEILCHEQVHVRQWHSLDVMLAEVLVAVLWFNPLVWIWRSMMKQNLETENSEIDQAQGLYLQEYFFL